ncbi:MAG: hypothetical protein NTW25_15900 [Candidatus Kapabacteria bacterium]|nr:hypothetical protein [Candidatus Kapabacteria bacterium]
MIAYESSNSKFFIENKTFCELIQSQLKYLNIECFGYCNSYGYEFKARFNRNNFEIILVCSKKQYTQNGVVIPKDANEYLLTEITLNGLQSNTSFILGKSSIKRLFTSKEFKEIFPSPFYIKTDVSADNIIVKEISQLIEILNFSKLIISDGKFVCKINSEIPNLLEFVANLEILIIKYNL